MMGATEVFYNLPLGFGREDHVSSSGNETRRFGIDSREETWWRPGGYFSKPLLGNPQFRKLFLARTREILEDIYTDEGFLPIIATLRDRLKTAVKLPAALTN